MSLRGKFMLVLCGLYLHAAANCEFLTWIKPRCIRNALEAFPIKRVGLMPTLSFFLASMIILITPGPTNTLLASCGAAFGLRRAAFLALAEAMGYVVAISAFVALAAALKDHAYASSAVKMAAAGWLAWCAVRLWHARPLQRAAAPRDCFARVFVTTLVNPKAMLVGTVFIPSGLALGASGWVLAYAALSTLAGLAWVAFGSLLPAGAKRHAFKFASLVLGGFSLAALAGAVHG